MKGQCSPFVLLAVLGGLGSSPGYATHVTRRGVDNPSAEDYIRRSCHAVTVIGDYVYIDGGMVTERVNSSDPGASPSYAVNSTLSISLKESWTNETVELRSIPKTAPLLSKQIHWTDPSTSSFYTWGGMSNTGSPPSNELWRLAADGEGGGAWSPVSQQDYRDFSQLTRPMGAAFAQSGDVGYALGGVATSLTDSDIHKENPGYALTGLVSYNFQTGTWTNTSSAHYGGYGTSLNARAEYVPLGPNGLLLFLGGAETPVDATNETIVQVTWNSLTMVDPVTGEWFTQGTTGVRPPTTESACSVGALGPNGTYEIFIYGGVSDQLSSTSSDVHILSLPGFNFFKANTEDGTPRSDHGCAVVGRRQMLSVGGVDGANRTYTPPTTADPWAQGLGIFDMTALQWTDSFDPNAAAYDTPDTVKDWYAAGGLNGVQWAAPALQALFVNGSTSALSNTTDGNITDASATTGTPTSTIVGGAVGGAVGAAFLGMATFFLMRRRRQRQQKQHKNKKNSREKMVEVDDGIAEYRPDPWPKEGHGAGGGHPHPRYMSPVSGITEGTAVEAYGVDYVGGGGGFGPGGGCGSAEWEWRGELPDHETGWHTELQGSEVKLHRPGGAGVDGAVVREVELPGVDVERTYELPAPIPGPRHELPDRKYTS
ncbi:Uu.00g010100.m01.CDS01 [Anthostomella pinea]|uniref:Uu.00g010100.m01.CDS01 n=1 Tax=Anthostomella pinea TaxID=933095 RepID=A0AAI8YQ39_9PEZI|nr:Uu.00g010100.m01.CDS01 [Anthostomella pinea]